MAFDMITAEGHIVTAFDDAAIRKGIYGDLTVGEIGEKLEYQIVSSNVLRVKSGVLMGQGRQIIIKPNTYEDFTFDNGTQGTIRYDICGFRYIKSGDTETLEKFVKKGTGVESVPTVNDLWTGATSTEFGLYQVMFNGLVMEEVTPLFDTCNTLPKLSEKGAVATIGNYGKTWNLDKDYKPIAGKEIRNTNQAMFDCTGECILVKKEGYYLVCAQTNCFSDDGTGTVWMKVNKMAGPASSDPLSAQTYIYKGYATASVQGVVWCNVGDKLNILVSASTVSGTLKCAGQDKLTVIKL